MQAPTDLLMERGLPCNLYAEQCVLGAVLMDESRWLDVTATISREDFSVEKHRRIFSAMGAVKDDGQKIDRVTLTSKLMERDQLQSVDGLDYIISLDNGLPQSFNIDSYIAIVVEKARRRALVFKAQELMNRALRDDEDAASILSGMMPGMMDLSAVRQERGLASVQEIIDGYPGGVNALLSGTRRVGLSTGFTRFDSMTRGLHPGELVIIAARPSIGKTALALNIASHVGVRLNKRVAVFSLEMGRDDLFLRMLCSQARVDSQRLGSTDASEARRLNVALASLGESNLQIDDSFGLTLPDLHRKVRRKMQEGGIDLVVIDYLQLMEVDRGLTTRNLQVAGLSRGMKMIAKECNVPVVCLSQLSRSSERRDGHRPQLSDLRDSGAIEQDADVVAFIHREEYYNRDDASLRGLAELIVAKQRNGPVGTIDLVYRAEITRFEDRVPDALTQDAPPVREPGDLF